MTTHIRLKPMDVAIGKKIAEQREQRSISLEQAAQALGLTAEAYFLREKGQDTFTAGDLFALADYFSCTASELMPNEKDLRDIPARERFGDAEEVADLIHYFSGVASPALRAFFLRQVRDASVHETKEHPVGANAKWVDLPKTAKVKGRFRRVLAG